VPQRSRVGYTGEQAPIERWPNSTTPLAGLWTERVDVWAPWTSRVCLNLRSPSLGCPHQPANPRLVPSCRQLISRVNWHKPSAVSPDSQCALRRSGVTQAAGGVVRAALLFDRFVAASMQAEHMPGRSGPPPPQGGHVARATQLPVLREPAALRSATSPDFCIEFQCRTAAPGGTDCSYRASAVSRYLARSRSGKIGQAP